MKEQGWISLHRKILDWEWYDDINVRLLFIHCLLRANHKDQTWKGKLIKRGQFVTGRQELAQECGLSVQQTRTALSKLETTREITTKRSRKGTLLTICNYDDYQNLEKNKTGKSTNRSTANQPEINQQSNQKVTTNNNDNKLNNISPPPLEGESVRSGKKKKGARERSKEYIPIAEYLSQIIKQHKDINHSKQQVKSWADDIRKLVEVNKVSLDRIETALVWYKKNAGGQYVPVIESGSSLREKFTKIEEAIKRERGPQINSQSAYQKTKKKLSREEAQKLADQQRIQFSPSNFTKVSDSPELYIFNQ